MKYFAVLDTNVLVSALLRKESVPAQIYREASDGSIVPLYSEDILAEYENVLHRGKFLFSEDEVRETIDTIKRRGVPIDVSPDDFVLPDDDDVVFYAVVMEKRKETDTDTDADAYLVTGNLKHFPKEPFIVTPREMLDIIHGQTGKEKKT